MNRGGVGARSLNIELQAPDSDELTASFDGRIVTYGFGELDMLAPAYAATIHKSQGSEYPAVVIPRCYPRQEAGCARWPEEGCRHRGS
jgi:ATP-dependent exoDNAse (exonuclease V) alpha subunit